MIHFYNEIIILDNSSKYIIDITDNKILHEIIRASAFDNALITITTDFGHILPIDKIKLDRIYYEDAQEVINNWRKCNKRDWIEFDWSQERSRQTKRIDVTIRCCDILCGLMLAKRSKKRLCVTLRYLEGNPNKHPLSGYILPIALIIAESFAYEYNIKQVCISRPAKGLISQYTAQGYELNPADKARQKRNNKPRAKLMSKILGI